ncbi:hypothetical protein D6D54_08285 [Spiroplasma poulsonii]|uniref:Uncharacterized protein n=1 Tax=Spiroplasma poulsonii TaxID=2138 RepID=A0A433EMY8_9MOLU|nr:hypothetical protein [Spiroplasma poulsonii]MBW3057825.1 hypothetical protein [Spiroplasma poulsonii]MBW3059191.1 hypothetical protein [Spiroplasma poulsonii]RUP75583.1 hypothetical protein D6D54_08285 [Spiroplasma poulsonii]
MIKIGIDPSGTGTTAVAIFEDNKLIDKSEYTNCDWIAQTDIILDKLKQDAIINIEDCLYTSASASKDRDDLLKLIGAIKYKTEKLLNINWVSPRHTKSVVKNMENLSKYNDSSVWKYEKDTNLTYEYGKGWKYKNEKISNHLRDAIIIANYES